MCSSDMRIGVLGKLRLEGSHTTALVNSHATFRPHGSGDARYNNIAHLSESARSKDWNAHVGDVEQMAASPGFVELREEILERAHLSSGDCVLDIGAGTGLLALVAAPHAERVIALDSSQAMCFCLADKFTRLGIPNAEAVCATATALPIADRSVDVVLSNYCFHHLTDEDKLRALREVRRVLRPGGRLVFADMMFSFGPLARRNREVIALVAGRMIRRGWSGVLRLCRNAIRVLAGRGEHPAGAAWWQEALLEAGFADIQVRVLAHEGGIASAKAPDGIDQPEGSGRHRPTGSHAAAADVPALRRIEARTAPSSAIVWTSWRTRA